MHRRNYRPGDRVPESGIYRVEHSSHRLMHLATLAGDMRFPLCKQCGRSVRYHLLRIVRTSQVLPFRSNMFLEEYRTKRPELVHAV